MKAPEQVIKDVMEQVTRRNPNEPEFHQAVWEVLESLTPVIEKHPEFVEAGILERIVELNGRLFSECLGLTTTAGFMSTVVSGFSSTAPSDPTKAACASIPQ